MTLIDPAPTVVDFKRDRWGRPLIVPKGGGKAVPYTRSSSAAKTIEDTYNLELWARRNVVYGLARDASLVARTLAIGGDPSAWDLPTKQLVNKIAEDAATVAQAHKGADIGTALHTLTQRIDLGETVDGGIYQPDLDAYVAAMAAAGLDTRPEWVECRMVCDELELAGTADRIVVRRGALCAIADLKTGASVDYGGLGWSAQLAAYARGEIYDPANDTRLPTPDLDVEVGYIIHLPAGQGRCTIYAIDLVQGYRAAMLANEVRAIRKASKAWITPLAVAAPWPNLTPQEQQQALDAVDGDGNPDEGEGIASDGPTSLQRHYMALGSEQRSWIGGIALEAKQARRPFGLNEKHTLRRFEILRGLVHLAEAGIDDHAVVRALTSMALDSDAPLFPSVTVGAGVGALDAPHACDFAVACDLYVAGHYVVGDGTPLRLRHAA